MRSPLHDVKIPSVFSTSLPLLSVKMTKQNAAEELAAMMNPVAPSPMTEAHPSQFSSQRPPRAAAGTSSGNYSVKKLLSQLELGGICGLVDSMRASSPTHARSIDGARVAAEEGYGDWMRRYPSASNYFDEIATAMKGKKVVVFLDYDGTLSPIVDDPDRAYMSEDMRDAVKDAASHFSTAIVTGRCFDKVFKFVKLPELYYAGSHGMDIKVPKKESKHSDTKTQTVLFQPASEFLPMIDEVYKILLEKTKCIPGARVENNKFCLSVHFRCVDEQKWHSLAEMVRSVLSDYPKLRKSQGRKVLEIRPDIKWDKGKAVEFLLESLGFDDNINVFPIYIGDDRTDEDAFKVLRDRGQGIGILVSKFLKETNALYSLREPAEVREFLLRLVEWKLLSEG